jgi:hypothetical protein
VKYMQISHSPNAEAICALEVFAPVKMEMSPRREAESHCNLIGFKLLDPEH